jgi:hypothetical protein
MATSVGHSVVVRRVAMAVATVDLLGVVCLILFSLSVVPSGPSRRHERRGWRPECGVGISHLVLPTRSDPAARR